MQYENSKITKKKMIFILLLIIVSLGIFKNSFNGIFFFDDINSIIKNPTIKKLWPPWHFFHWEQNNTDSGRPIFTITLAINYAIGKLDPFGYHIGNLIIHTMCSILFFLILLQTLKQTNIHKKMKFKSENLAFITALIWMIHPLQTECVNYITQRSSSLVALFYLATLYCSIKAHCNINKKKWYFFSILCCLLGLFTKETMATAPLVIILYDVTFFYKSNKKILRERKYFYLFLLSTWIIFGVVAIWADPHANTIGSNLYISPWEYLISQSSILTTYLKLIFFPHPLNIDYGFAFKAKLLDYLANFIFISLIFIGSVLIYFKNRAIGFAGLCFFIILGPTSSIIPLLNEVGAERRMYLPSMFIISMLTVSGYNTFYYLKEKRFSESFAQYGIVIILSSIIIILGELTILRNNDYRSHIRIWETAIIANPSNPRAYKALGTNLLKINQIDAAIECYQRAIKYGPGYRDVYVILGDCMSRKKRYKQALSYYLIALSMNPKDVNLQRLIKKLNKKLDFK